MNLIKKLLIAGCCAALLSGCKKDDPAPDNNLSYKIDGILKSTKAEGTYFIYDSTIMIDGTKGSEDFTLFIDTVLTPGTYNMDTMHETVAVIYVNWDNAIIYYGSSGTLTIDSYDGRQISGTFRANVKAGHEVKNISEGKFTAHLEDSTNSYGDDSPPDCPDSTYEVMKHQKLLLLHKPQNKQ